MKAEAGMLRLMDAQRIEAFMDVNVGFPKGMLFSLIALDAMA